MTRGKTRTEVTLLDVLVDGFEKNESLAGWHWRQLPMPDEVSARGKFADLVGEARRWKGEPTRIGDEGARRVCAWPDLEVRQQGPGVLVLVRAPRFDDWWHDPETWQADPMAPLHAWWSEEREAARR